MAAVGHEAVQLDEAALVEQEVEALAGGELALLVLLGDPLGAAALLGLGLAVVELVEEIAGIGHGGENVSGRVERQDRRLGGSAEGGWNARELTRGGPRTGTHPSIRSMVVDDQLLGCAIGS